MSIVTRLHGLLLIAIGLGMAYITYLMLTRETELAIQMIILFLYGCLLVFFSIFCIAFIVTGVKLCFMKK